MRTTTRAACAALALAAALAASAAEAQRVRRVEDSPAAQTTGAKAGTPAPAPSSVKAKYEGGVLGYRKTDGWLSFDDANRRLVFKGQKTQKELFSLSYDAVLAAWADTKSQTSTAGRVVQMGAPYGIGLAGLLMRSKSRYLVVQYRDPDTRSEGVTSFKIGDKEVLNSSLVALAERAELTRRGDAYIRQKTATTTNPGSTP